MLDNKVEAYVEEERLIRVKHAAGAFPIKSIEYVLKASGVEIDELDHIAQAWDCHKYDNGIMAAHYEQMNQEYPTNDEDRAYQQKLLNNFCSENQKSIILNNLKQFYGERKFPEISFVNHHLAHACTAFFNSGMEESLVLNIDGSGEETTTSWWLGKGQKLELLKEVQTPHSLGWLYSAITEFLGFRAYDGEYKVMGLAAYGKHSEEIWDKMSQMLQYDDAGAFRIDPMIFIRGKHSYSNYFSDQLVEHFGVQPRTENAAIEQWYKDCAYAAQKLLEETVKQMLQFWINKTGVKKLCISGGVGLNVKMNGRIWESDMIDDFFIYPICSDAGSSIGAAMALRYQLKGLENQRLNQVYLGPEYSDAEIKKYLQNCKIPFQEVKGIEKTVADLVSQGKIVAWFQGRMEGGPRSLGARSIIADPRDPKAKDKVNEVIKYREIWRPFCPAMTVEGGKKYLSKYNYDPFMITTFTATECAKDEIPSAVHIDNTSRPQIVEENSNPRFYKMIQEFNKITGVPVVLNTSFNIKGEPTVCSPYDAIRTFYSTGLDTLAIENILIHKDSNGKHSNE